MARTVKQAMDDLDDAVQVTYAKLFNAGKYHKAESLARSAKKLATSRWCGSHDMEVVRKGLDLVVKFLDLERKAEEASKEVS